MKAVHLLRTVVYSPLRVFTWLCMVPPSWLVSAIVTVDGPLLRRLARSRHGVSGS